MKKILLLLFGLLISAPPALLALPASAPPEEKEAYDEDLDEEEGLEETEAVEEESGRNPLTRAVEGVNEGTEKLLDRTVKGAYRVATLGQSKLESYEIEEPEKGSGEPTKIKISIPGT
ncbi:MAG: hypothetical protein HYU34_02655 [Candidatus Omnitrophica bacterium]|nr:hypothetical protein [Candidatus Omnitrophota bacterium]